MAEGPAVESSPTTVPVCTNCGTASPLGARICHRCFASLEDATLVDADSVTVRRRGLDLSLPRTNRGWAALVLAVVALLFAVWWVRGWLSGPPPPLPAVLGERSVQLPGAAWSLPNGGLDGARRTSAGVELAVGASWAWRASSEPSTLLVTDGDAVYVGLEEGVLVSVSAADGRERWRVAVPGVLESAPAPVDGRLYVGYRSGSVAALDATSGETHWETQLGVSISSTPIVVDGVVFAAGNGVIGGFDAEDGTPIWRRTIGDSLVPTTPVVDAETLVVGTFDRVLIFDRRNGALLSWVRFAPQFAPIVSVAVDGGLIVATASGQVMAIETTMRRPWWDGVRGVWEFLHLLGAAPDPPWRPDRWTVETTGAVYPAALGEEIVVLAGLSGLIRAHSRENGEVIWEVQLGAINGSPLITAGGVLLVGSDRAWLLNVADGSVSEEFALDGDALAVVPVESGTFVLTSNRIEGRLGTEPP